MSEKAITRGVQAAHQQTSDRWLLAVHPLGLACRGPGSSGRLLPQYDHLLKAAVEAMRLVSK